MRASEFTEAINPDIIKPGYTRETVYNSPRGPIRLVAQQKGSTEVFPSFFVYAYDGDKPVGYVRFSIRDLERYRRFGGMKKDPSAAYLVSGSTKVNDAYQKLGIARAMYQFMRRLGNDLAPSETQTDQGRAMWASFARSDALAEVDETLTELSFLGSECTKDCSGHRAGYEWYKRKGYEPASWSNSFNKGAALAHAGK